MSQGSSTHVGEPGVCEEARSQPRSTRGDGGKKQIRSRHMENLFETSLAVKLQETFYNSWAAADDRGPPPGRGGSPRAERFAATVLETGCLKF